MSLQSFKQDIIDKWIEENYPLAREDGYLPRKATVEINIIENFLDRLIDWNLLKLTNKND